MKLELVDMTKEELVRLIKSTCYSLPTQRDLLNARWESLVEEAQRTREQALHILDKYKGIGTMEAHRHWLEGQLLFDKGMAIDKKADIVMNELEGLRNETN